MRILERIRRLNPLPLKGPNLAYLKTVEDENALLRQHAAKQITDATLMTSLHVHSGGMELGMEGGAAGILVERLAQQFLETGAKNFIELKFQSVEMMPGECFTVTIQRMGGETPGDQLKRLKAELAQAAAALGSGHEGAG